MTQSGVSARSGDAGVTPALHGPAASETPGLWMTGPVEADWIYYSSSHLVAAFGMVLFRLKAFGREHIPATGGCIIASTHQSHLDPPFVACMTHRKVYHMARESLFRWPLGALIRFYGAFPVKRGGMGLDGLRAAIEHLRAGHAVMMFPEGARTPDGGIQELKPGVVSAAAKAGVPIIPAAVEGAYWAWPRAARLFAPKTIKVKFGAPLHVTEDTPQAQAEALRELRRRFEALRGQLEGR